MTEQIAIFLGYVLMTISGIVAIGFISYQSARFINYAVQKWAINKHSIYAAWWLVEAAHEYAKVKPVPSGYKTKDPHADEELIKQLVSEYWEIAYTEGKTGISRGTYAQEVLSAINSALHRMKS